MQRVLHWKSAGGYGRKDTYDEKMFCSEGIGGNAEARVSTP